MLLPDWQTAAAFLLGLAVAVLVGHLVVGRWLHPTFTARINGQFPEEARRAAEQPSGRWISKRIGMLETFVYFLLFSFTVPGTAVFILGWVGLKMATGWNRLKNASEYNRRTAMAALVFNLVNVLFGAFGAFVFCWLSTAATS